MIKSTRGRFIAPSTLKILSELCEAPRSPQEMAKAIRLSKSDVRHKIIELRERGFDIRIKRFRKDYRGGKGSTIYYLKR